MCAAVLGCTPIARADGITVSTDGLVWTSGAGEYGKGWGNTGQGVSVRQGETVYIKFYSNTPGGTLAYAEHGRSWGWWRSTGPNLEGRVGGSPAAPVILKISNIGTPGSTACWINGPGTSGLWSAFTAPGPYDLGLGEDAQWTSPPLVVREASLLSRLFGAWGGAAGNSGAASEDTVHAVPDGTTTLPLLGGALVVLALCRRIFG